MKAPSDLSLMLVTDAAMCRDRGLVETVLAAVAGGVTVVQLRDKTCSDGEMVATARMLRARLAPLGVPLIVNDRPAVALAAGADGVHIGQGDGDPAKARAMVGRQMLLGLSVTGPRDRATVDPAVVDYVGLGPVFASATKADATPPLGLAGFRAVARELGIPVVAIGGIDAGNAGALIAAGAAGVAVVSAICAAADPRAAAAALRRAMGAPEARHLRAS
jgi:thiamine-phosphate pyrophosphorylase